MDCVFVDAAPIRHSSNVCNSWVYLPSLSFVLFFLTLPHAGIPSAFPCPLSPCSASEILNRWGWRKQKDNRQLKTKRCCPEAVYSIAGYMQGLHNGWKFVPTCGGGCVCVALELFAVLAQVPGVLLQDTCEWSRSRSKSKGESTGNRETEKERGARVGRGKWMKNSFVCTSQKPFCLRQESSASNCRAGVVGLCQRRWEAHTQTHMERVEDVGWGVIMGSEVSWKQSQQHNSSIYNNRILSRTSW